MKEKKVYWKGIIFFLIFFLCSKQEKENEFLPTFFPSNFFLPYFFRSKQSLNYFSSKICGIYTILPYAMLFEQSY